MQNNVFVNNDNRFFFLNNIEIRKLDFISEFNMSLADEHLSCSLKTFIKIVFNYQIDLFFNVCYRFKNKHVKAI